MLYREPGFGRALAFSGFEAADDREPELGCASAVDDSVVERERYVAKWSNPDLAVADDWALGNAPEAENGYLGVVDDRRLE